MLKAMGKFSVSLSLCACRDFRLFLPSLIILGRRGEYMRSHGKVSVLLGVI